VKERPILFAGPALIRALLDGDKTQTRRPVRAGYDRRPCPFGEPGDGLWVRESWAGDDLSGVAFRADHPAWPSFRGDGEQPDSPWRPSIHMPRWASRLSLEVTAVRVEPLQALTEPDATAEGIGEPPWGARAEAYATLWDTLNAARAPWSSNPLVWVVSFRRVGR
jgi:hypothetical protein